MRLVTFTHDRRTRTGALLDGAVVDLTAAGLPATMAELLGAGALDAARDHAASEGDRLPLDEVRLEAPVRPPKFMAVGVNDKGHKAELTPRRMLRNLDIVRAALGWKIAHPKSRYPIFFAKATSCVTGPYDQIWQPADSPTVDYEGEVCVVIGRRCRNVALDDVRAVVAGYTITNDLSVRGWQLDSIMGPIIAKGFETHGPLGPCILTADEAPRDGFELRTFVNGEQRQHGNTRDLIAGPDEVVSVLSRFCTLEPGDVIALGTFAGIGMFDKRYLAPGDVVRVEVDGIGAIENRMVDEPAVEPDPLAARFARR